MGDDPVVRFEVDLVEKYWASRQEIADLQAECARLAGDLDDSDIAIRSALKSIYLISMRHTRALCWAWGYRRAAGNHDAQEREIARLVDKLTVAERERDDLERRRIVYANQVAQATEATRREHADALAFQIEQRNLRHAAWLEEQRRREVAEAESARLRAALERYGAHLPRCVLIREGKACDCDLSAALEA